MVAAAAFIAVVAASEIPAADGTPPQRLSCYIGYGRIGARGADGDRPA